VRLRVPGCGRIPEMPSVFSAGCHAFTALPQRVLSPRTGGPRKHDGHAICTHPSKRGNGSISNGTSWIESEDGALDQELSVAGASNPRRTGWGRRYAILLLSGALGPGHGDLVQPGLMLSRPTLALMRIPIAEWPRKHGTRPGLTTRRLTPDCARTLPPGNLPAGSTLGGENRSARSHVVTGWSAPMGRRHGRTWVRRSTQRSGTRDGSALPEQPQSAMLRAESAVVTTVDQRPVGHLRKKPENRAFCQMEKWPGGQRKR
jgi:hypothetical protein